MNSTGTTKNNLILVKKASGEQEPFSKEKLERSLVNAGAKPEIISKIIHDINNWVTTGLTTKKIYQRAFSLLRRERSANANRYKLKQAIYEMGPSGYPFETLIGEIFKLKGFSAEVGVVVRAAGGDQADPAAPR